MKNYFGLRWTFFIVGLAILSCGVALTIKGQRYGVGSWDVLHVGLYKSLGLTIGSWSIILGLIIVIVTSIILKQLPKIGTIANMLLTGTFIDFFNYIIPDAHTAGAQLICFIAGIIILGFGDAIYITANLGAGPRDSLMLIAVEKTKLNITTARTAMEFVVAVAGYLIGGPVGIGTVIMVFALGPVIQFSMKYTNQFYQSLTQDKHIVPKNSEIK
ncbi:MAG: YitT family protein [Kurthia sp.]|nr:YitT family protein [Candidatus Kurthia equi]